jgi:hypothetical protein
MAVKGSATVTISQYRDTESVTRYYKLQSSSMAAPDKPSNVKPNETPAGWSKSEPACDITKTLYTCDVTVFSDKTTHVSDVSKSTSYEAAKEAWNKANNAQGTANEAKKYTDNALNNYGYQYAAEIEVAGDPNTYYPVMIFSKLEASQDVMREILVKRSYYEKAPAEWKGHPTTHGIALTCKIKCNFGGWGGALYDWRIHELNEMYGNVFAGCEVCAQGLGFAIFLRGGGAKYTIYSDMPLSDAFRTNPTTMEAPSIWYEKGMFGWSGGTAENPEYPFYTPEPRTYTDAVIKEIHDKTYIQVATDAYKNADTAQNTANKAQSSADTAQNTANKAQSSANTAQNTADKAQSSADKAQNTATEAAKTADNYISTDSTGIMVSENKGATKETPSNATKNNVLITEKDVQIRNGQKVVASYGETITIGEKTGEHTEFTNSGFFVSSKNDEQFSVKGFCEGELFRDSWIKDATNQWHLLNVEYLADQMASVGKYDETFKTTFVMHGRPKRVAFVFEDGSEMEVLPIGKSDTMYYTSGENDSNGETVRVVINGNPGGANVPWQNISALYVEYTIDYNPATVRIGAGATKDVYRESNGTYYDYKALKIGGGQNREGRWEDENAFEVDFDGTASVGGNLIVNGDTETQVLYVGGTIACLGAINCGELIAAAGPEGEDVSFTTTVSGTGKITLTTGAVEYQPRWWRCGNIVQMEVGTKCTREVESGANIAAGKITGVPKPITKSGVRAVSYYGNNSNISYMGSDGTFYARNAGADALKKGNDCIGSFTYITDGTML